MKTDDRIKLWIEDHYDNHEVGTIEEIEIAGGRCSIDVKLDNGKSINLYYEDGEVWQFDRIKMRWCLENQTPIEAFK